MRKFWIIIYGISILGYVCTMYADNDSYYTTSSMTDAIIRAESEKEFDSIISNIYYLNESEKSSDYHSFNDRIPINTMLYDMTYRITETPLSKDRLKTQLDSLVCFLQYRMNTVCFSSSNIHYSSILEENGMSFRQYQKIVHFLQLIYAINEGKFDESKIPFFHRYYPSPNSDEIKPLIKKYRDLCPTLNSDLIYELWILSNQAYVEFNRREWWEEERKKILIELINNRIDVTILDNEPDSIRKYFPDSRYADHIERQDLDKIYQKIKEQVTIFYDNSQ